LIKPGGEKKSKNRKNSAKGRFSHPYIYEGEILFSDMDARPGKSIRAA
jgi:hypothetical protein